MKEVEEQSFGQNAPVIVEALAQGAARRVLFVRTGRVGDLLFLTPILRAFRDRYPDASLDVVVSEYAAKVLRHNPLVDELIPCDVKGPRWTRWYRKRKLRDTLRGRAYDVAIDLSRTSKLRKHLLRAGIPLVYNAWEEQTSHGYDRHIVEQMAEGVAPLGLDQPPGPLEIYYSPRETAVIDDLLERRGIGGDRFAVVHPGCFQISSHKLQTFSARRLWPLESFRELAERLHAELGLRVIFSGAGPEEARLIGKLSQGMSTPVVPATDLDILELAALLDRAALFVSVDTGPMHISAALKTPLVALFGPSPVHYTRPWGEGKIAVLCKYIECSPCRGKGVTCFNNICMKQITVDEVLEASRQVMEPGSGQLLAVSPQRSALGVQRGNPTARG